MDVFLVPLLKVVIFALEFYFYIVLGYVILSWLMMFEILNPQQPLVSIISRFLFEATEPVLRQIRRRLPAFNSLDISPIVLGLAIFFLQEVLRTLIMKIYGGS